MLTKDRKDQLAELWPDLRRQLRAMILSEANKAQRMKKQPDGSYRLENTEPRRIGASELDDLISAATVWIVIQLDDQGSLTADPRLIWRSVANALQDRSPWNGPKYNHTATGLIAPESATKGRTRTYRVSKEYTATIRMGREGKRRRGSTEDIGNPEHIASFCVE